MEVLEATGRRIGRYEVLSLLGSGGHGEVWLARDPQLLREVALKLLSSNYRSGLEREARTISALNHPNIVTVYEIGRADGVDFIAQEFVRGETLRQRLAGGPLPLVRAVAVCRQVAAALEAVHAAGLVHRDIKPENLMIRPDGLVKVLDFGLARSVDRGRRPGATHPGAVLGSVKYLSPEQARGLEVDARSDIFSLGAVMYEMLAGDPAFPGQTEVDIMAAILKTEPEPLSKRVPGIPEELDGMLRLCLEKDREKRTQTAGELRIALDRVARQLEGKSRYSPAKKTLVTAAILILLAASYLIYKKVTRPPIASPFNSMQISLLSAHGQIADAAISGDGKFVAYALDEGALQSLWLRKLGTTDDVRIASAAAGGYSGLTFSAAGTFLYYVRQGRDGIKVLYRMPSFGGGERKIETEMAGPVSFSRDGSHYAFVRLDSTRWESALVVGNADGSEKRVLAIRRRPEYLGTGGLAWSPDGRAIACFEGNATFYTSRAFQLVEFNLDGKLKRVITPHTWAWVSSVLWSSDGRTLILAAGDKVDGELQIWLVNYQDGQVRRVTNDLSNYNKLSLSADSRKLLAVRSETLKRLWVTKPGGTSHASPVPVGVLRDLNTASWTPDGRIVFSASAGDYRNLWIMDADGGNLKQLTSGADDKAEVDVTPDGRYILYQSRGKIWRVNLDGSDLRQLTHGAWDVHPSSSADSRSVVYASFEDWSPVIGGKPSLWRVSIDGGEPFSVSAAAASLPRVSPDGKFIAYFYFPGVDPRFSAYRIGVVPFSGTQPARSFALEATADSSIAWEPDAKSIDYVQTTDGVGNVWRQPLSGGRPEQLTSFETDRIFEFAWSLKRKQIVLARGEMRSDIALITSFN